ncbi:MAG: hypothetical protein HQL29_05715 [Candidatus Omnitrophica bacterium]|nr:hypothetical protein [Candidatus Omnitrophota bacterium]
MKKIFLSILIASQIIFPGISHASLLNNFFGTNFKKIRDYSNPEVLSIDLKDNLLFSMLIDFLKKENFRIYKQDALEHYVVVMGLDNQTDTTMVGIFLEDEGYKTKVLINSLSSPAKEKMEHLLSEFFSYYKE